MGRKAQPSVDSSTTTPLSGAPGIDVIFGIAAEPCAVGAEVLETAVIATVGTALGLAKPCWVGAPETAQAAIASVATMTSASRGSPLSDTVTATIPRCEAMSSKMVEQYDERRTCSVCRGLQHDP
jgi:hypothetical protein